MKPALLSGHFYVLPVSYETRSAPTPRLALDDAQSGRRQGLETTFDTGRAATSAGGEGDTICSVPHQSRGPQKRKP
jgi:hypothetical protein